MKEERDYVWVREKKLHMDDVVAYEANVAAKLTLQIEKKIKIKKIIGIDIMPSLGEVT